MFHGEKLKKLREDKGWSLQDLVFELAKIDFRITRQTIDLWENGDTEPRASDLKSLADFFGVSVDFFFDSEGNKQLVV
jgi:transcriptional regulator with XRE-family HTH domain